METRTRLDATIRKSWKLLSQHVPDFPPELGGQRPFALENSLTLTLLFYESEGRLQCAQVGYFGFYALRAILRGILLSVNHLGAANRLAQFEIDLLQVRPGCWDMLSSNARVHQRRRNAR